MEEDTPPSVEQKQPEISKPAQGKTFLHQLKEEPKDWVKIGSLTLSAVLIISGGIITGHFLASQKVAQVGQGGRPKVIKTEKVVGSTDVKTFRDSAEGKLEKGGIDGEGSHHLVRVEGRPDQNAYLTSSIVDLDQYVGKKVKVWGETFAAQKAGWLMDVGKIELLE